MGAVRPRGRHPRVTRTGAAPAPGRALTPREARFVDEYLLDLNATQAAIRAGYSARTAGSIGSENLTKPDIEAAIAAAIQARSSQTAITRARVLEELGLLAFSDITHYGLSSAGEVTLVPGAPAGAMRAVQSIKRRVTTRGRGTRATVVREVEIRLWEKPGSLKLAGQHVGLFTDRLEHSGKVTLEQALAASREPDA